jgi:hypothetical protein
MAAASGMVRSSGGSDDVGVSIAAVELKSLVIMVILAFLFARKSSRARV